jgi:hypothetical protein
MMANGVMAGLNYLNSALYPVGVLLYLTVLILLFRRFRLVFLLWLIASAAMALTYLAVSYWYHYIAPHPASAAPRVAAILLYTGGMVTDVIGLVGCMSYLRKLNREFRTTNTSTIRR